MSRPLTPRSYLPNNKVAIVCSARSTQTKALGTTNLLLQASREALAPASARQNSTSASGAQTPLYPKRVGSGYFSQSMMSSLSSLKDAKDESRCASPSPFQPLSGRTRSPSDSGPDTPTAKEESFEPRFHTTVDTIKRGHLDAARQALRRGPLRDELEEEIERDCEALRSFLSAAHVSVTTLDVSQAGKDGHSLSRAWPERPTIVAVYVY